MNLLLASRSETRRDMLERAGISFRTVPAEIDEEAVKDQLRRDGLGAAALAEALAGRKAMAAIADSAALVLGSDQTLECDDGSMLDKPRSREDAFRQLQALAGRSHRLHAAAAIVERGQAVWSCVETVELAVRPLTDGFIQDYLDQEYNAIRWSVGGYRIESVGVQLFERIDGSHFAILGMPLLPLLAYLRTRGVIAS